MWLQFGGHADGEVDLLQVALREFHEESGIIEEPKLYREILDVDVHNIPAR
jgi:8-oxo-dGTP pyrophosphatase MutT (NUDIX family)